MFVSEIKRRFKVAADEMSANWSNTQLNQIFSRAQVAYLDMLANNYGADLENEVDIQPYVKTAALTPVSNIIPISGLSEYDRVVYLKPTYVVNGITYSYPSKPLPQTNRYSVFSNGTYRYPRHYLIDDNIVLQPSDTPTAVDVVYLRGIYDIDFTIADYDVAITDKNVDGIIGVALRHIATSQREYDQAAGAQQQNILDQQGT